MKTLPKLSPHQPSKKQPVVLLIGMVLIMLSCNFPLTDFSGIFRGYETLDPAIFDSRPTATASLDIRQTQPAATQKPEPDVDRSRYHVYAARSGDTLSVVARHFAVAPDEISSPEAIAQTGILPTGQYLIIPRNALNEEQHQFILPDSAVIFSPCAEDFDVSVFIQNAGGYLSRFSQVVAEERISGAEVVQRVAINQSVNPRLLLAFIEYRAGLVTGSQAPADIYHPLRLGSGSFKGLYQELSLAARLINSGYYGWRHGEMDSLTFDDQVEMRVAPNLNAGSVGMMRLFAHLYSSSEWEERLIGEDGFMAVYLAMFPDPAFCAANVEPLLNDQVAAPTLELPFAPGEVWSFTAGPHYSWVAGTPLGALDFAPKFSAPKCQTSPYYARAVAAGIVTRVENSVVTLSLVDENNAFTGWEVMYMHIAAQGSVSVGEHLATGDAIGHPSCEGGPATGSHVHIARKYKGEWIGAAGIFDFILSGWTVVPGERAYLGKLVKEEDTVVANSGGNQGSLITR